VVAASSRSQWLVQYRLLCSNGILIKSFQGADVTDLDARDVELDLEARDYDADFEARDYADFEVEARDFEEGTVDSTVKASSVSLHSVHFILRSIKPSVRSPPLLPLQLRSPCQGL
jgi:hypothetical protein